MKVEKVALTCGYCGKTFYRNPYKLKQLESGYVKQVFCSSKCSQASRITGEVVICEHPGCGNKFYRGSSSTKKFCSLKCYYDIYNGENHPLWKDDKIEREQFEFTGHDRKKILDKYCWKCAVTGVGANDTLLHLHHIVPISEGGTGHISNGIPLTPEIHYKVHHEGLDIRQYIKE